jgi:hypothetical protein
MVVCVRFCHAHTPFKAIQPIGKTDIYNVLVAGGYLPTARSTKHKKNKSEGWEILI